MYFSLKCSLKAVETVCILDSLKVVRIGWRLIRYFEKCHHNLVFGPLANTQRPPAYPSGILQRLNTKKPNIPYTSKLKDYQVTTTRVKTRKIPEDHKKLPNGKEQRQTLYSKLYSWKTEGEFDAVPVPAAKSSHLRRGWAMVAQQPPLTDSTQKTSLLLTPQLWFDRCAWIWWMLHWEWKVGIFIALSQQWLIDVRSGGE